MTKKLALIILPGLVVIVLFAAFVLHDDRAASARRADCGLEVGPALKPVLEPGADGLWSIVSRDGQGIAPQVGVETADTARLAGPPEVDRGCALVLERTSPDGTRSTDWRIGRRFDATGLQGKTLRATFHLRAAQTALLPESSIYFYDGKKVVGRPVHRIGTDWESFELSYDVPQGTTELELWFRPFYDTGTARPARNTIFMAVGLREFTADQRAAADAVGLYDNPAYRQVRCPTVLPESLAGTAGGPAAADLWLAYAAAVSGRAPEIAVAPAPAGQPGCRLGIAHAGQGAGGGRDLRIGRALPVEALRGRRLTFAAELRADPAVRLEDASLYVYDGRTVSATPLESLDADWLTASVGHDVPADAPAVQVWLRLLFGDSAIEPGTSRIDFAPKVEIGPAD